jgi:hypothetical protein
MRASASGGGEGRGAAVELSLVVSLESYAKGVAQCTVIMKGGH